MCVKLAIRLRVVLMRGGVLQTRLRPRLCRCVLRDDGFGRLFVRETVGIVSLEASPVRQRSLLTVAICQFERPYLDKVGCLRRGVVLNLPRMGPFLLEPFVGVVLVCFA